MCRVKLLLHGKICLLLCNYARPSFEFQYDHVRDNKFEKNQSQHIVLCNRSLIREHQFYMNVAEMEIDLEENMFALDVNGCFILILEIKNTELVFLANRGIAFKN